MELHALSAIALREVKNESRVLLIFISKPCCVMKQLDNYSIFPFKNNLPDIVPVTVINNIFRRNVIFLRTQTGM